MSEQIDLNSSLPLEEKPDNTKPEVDVSGYFSPGQTNDDFLQSILSIPNEKLIPWEECSLPSKGIYYGWPDGTIRVRAMGATAEKVLATQRLAQSGQSIDYLFKECCQFPDGFVSEELLSGDRVFLLYYLRGITHGNKYEFAVTCPNPNCENLSTHTYDLNELAETISWANESLGTEPFKIILPYISKITGREVYVSVKFLRGYDLNDMLARRRMKKKMFARPGGVKTRQTRNQSSVNVPLQRAQNQALDDTITENLEKIIVNVQGSTNQIMIRQFINKMHAQDTATVREWLREFTPGIDNTVTIQCPECSQEFTIELPITESFFRPSKS